MILLSWFYNLLGGTTHNLKNTILYYIAGSKFSDTWFFLTAFTFSMCGWESCILFSWQHLRHKEVKYLAQGHTTVSGQAWAWSSLGGSHVQGLSPMFYSLAIRSFYIFQHGSHSGLCCISTRKPHKVCRKDSAKLVKYRFNKWLLPLKRLWTPWDLWHHKQQ